MLGTPPVSSGQPSPLLHLIFMRALLQTDSQIHFLITGRYLRSVWEWFIYLYILEWGGELWVYCCTPLHFDCCGWSRGRVTNMQMRTQKGHEQSVKSSIKSGEGAERRRWEDGQNQWRNLRSLIQDSFFVLTSTRSLLSVRLSAAVFPSSRLSVVERALLAFFQCMHIHDGSGSLHVEACARARVCRI